MGRPIWNVPYPRNDFFTGREDVIADLRKHLTKRRKAALAQAITGLGGIGKTQTAVEYAYRYRDKYKAVLWLNAESPLGLKTGSAELARLLHLPHPENDLDQAVLAFKQWLKTEAGWLLILDNADDPAMLTPFLPDAEHGHILITSRAQDFQDLGIIDPVELDELSVDDATAFLLHRCGRQEAEAEERDAASELARELDGLPLALEQAAAYIVDETRATFQRYLESYRTSWPELARGTPPGPRGISQVGGHHLGGQLRGGAGGIASRRRCVAVQCLPRPGRHPVRTLDPRGLPNSGLRCSRPSPRPRMTRSLVHDLLRPLGRFSLIRIDGHAETYSIHRMVQEVLKAAMDDATRRLWAERAVRAVNQAFPPVEYDNWPLCGRLLPHALAVASWIERGPHGVRRGGTAPQSDGLLPV